MPLDIAEALSPGGLADILDESLIALPAIFGEDLLHRDAAELVAVRPAAPEIFPAPSM
jgi:hypothetical protein